MQGFFLYKNCLHGLFNGYYIGLNICIQGLLNSTGVNGIMHWGERVKCSLNARVIYKKKLFTWVI